MNLIQVALALLGLLLAVRGRRLFRAALVVGAFALGSGLVAIYAPRLEEPVWLAPMLVLLGGIFAVLLVRVIHKAAVFVLAAVAAIVLAQALVGPLEVEPQLQLPVIVVAGLVGGLLGKFIEAVVLVLMTAGLGGWLVATSTLPALAPAALIRSPLLLPGCAALVAVVGVVAQTRTSKSTTSRPAEVERNG